METSSSAFLPWLHPGWPFLLASGILLGVGLVLRAALLRLMGSARYLRLTSGLEYGTLTLLCLTLVVLSVLQVVLRNFFHTGLIWIDPLLRHIVLWICFFGALTATRRGRHIAIDVLSVLLPSDTRRMFRRGTSLVAGLVCLALANGAFQYIQQEYEFGGDAFLGLRTWQIQSILLWGFLLLAYRFLVVLLWGTLPGSGGVEEAAGPEPVTAQVGQAPGEGE